jgi:RNA polymerase sigma-70 factor (ECF subfamily)
VSASTYRGEGSYRAWLFQIAKNTIATWRKDKRRAEVPVGDLPDRPDPDDSPVSLTLAREDLDLVSQTLDELPPAQREVVRLRYYKELTVDEIARITRRSSGAVRQLLHRARARMRSRLSGKDLTALLGATGASALVAYSIHRHRKGQR